MGSKNNKRTAILAVILLALLLVGYKVVFVSPSDQTATDENIAASQRVEAVLAEVESINFDMDILEDSKFQSLKSLETPLVNLPVGKRNPFGN